MKNNALVAAAVVSLGLAASARAGTYGIESLDLSQVEQGWGSPHANQSVDGHGLSIGGQKFEHGLGTHAVSTFVIALGGRGERFTASVGVDYEVGQRGSVTFKVTGDGKTLFESEVMRGGQAPKAVSVNLHGVKTLVLSVGDAEDGVDYDHADWAEAKFEMSEGKPGVAAAPRETAVVLTPPAPPTPRINGAK